MKHFFAGLGLALLAACSVQDPVKVAPREAFRDRSAQIASQTDVTAQRMSGSWVIRQRFANQPGPRGGMDLMALPGGALQWTFESGSCDEEACASVDVLVLLEPSGPGRWTPADPEAAGFSEELWVMWMDFDSRTMAIGTPSGAFGWIMDENTSGGADRITAARDIMDWFGYDIERLEEVKF